MKTYCNARLPVESAAHTLDSGSRSALLDDWLRAHSDAEIIDCSQRKKQARPRENSLSVALGMAPDQSRRLDGLLDGKWRTFSSLARRVFDVAGTTA